MTEWWLFEDEQSKNDRASTDFKKVAEKISQQANADLFTQQAHGILDGLYQQADAASGALQSQAQQFGDWARQQTGGESGSASTGELGSSARTVPTGDDQNGSGYLSPDVRGQSAPTEIDQGQAPDLTSPSKFDRQSQSAQTHVDAMPDPASWQGLWSSATDAAGKIGQGVAQGLDRTSSTPSPVLQDAPEWAARKLTDPFTGGGPTPEQEAQQRQMEDQAGITPFKEAGKRVANTVSNVATGQATADIGNAVAEQFGVPKVNLPVLGETGVGDVASMWQPGNFIGRAESTYGPKAAAAIAEHAPQLANAAEDSIAKTWAHVGSPDGVAPSWLQPEAVGEHLPAPAGTAERSGAATVPEMASGIVSGAESAPASDRYYHGTGGDFARPDPGKFDPNGLFGPGYYITDSPVVAGSGDVVRTGYAENGIPSAALQADSIANRHAQLKTELEAERQRLIEAHPDVNKYSLASLPDGAKYKDLQYEFNRAENDLAASGHATRDLTAGPNIRPVDVPRDLNLLDADAPVPLDGLGRIVDSLPATIKDAAEARFFGNPERTVRGYDYTGEDVHKFIARMMDGNPNEKAGEVNQILAQAGYDGIKYAGGKRIPMKDAAGNAIEHNAIAIFPESLDKITNATAGTPGGLLPEAAAPKGSPQAVDQAMAKLGGQAAYGGVAGGVSEAQNDPNATPTSIGTAALVGGAERAALGAARGKLGINGQSVSERLRSLAIARPPDGTRVDQSITANAASGPSLGDSIKALPNEITRQMFDNAVPLRKIDEAVANLRGAPAAFQDQAYKMLRLARGSAAAAEQAIEDHLGPVVHGVDNAGIDNLNRYLKSQDIIDKDAVSPGHNFGGADVADAQQKIQDLQQQLGPQAFQELHQKAEQVWKFGHDLLQRKLDSGLITQDLYNELTTKFPHYSPIRIIDWLDDAASGSGMQSGNKLSVNATGLKQLTEHGTDRASETPLDAYVRLAHETYRRSMMNEASQAMVKNLTELAKDPAWSKLITPADTDAAKLLGVSGTPPPRAPGQVPFHAFIKGDKYDFWLDKPLEQAINYQAPIWNPKSFSGIFYGIPSKILRAGATSANALFLIPNAVGDAMTYMVRNGGIANLPETLPSLAKGWQSAITRDAAYRDLRLTGGGFAGAFGVEAGAGKKTIQDLRGLNNTLKSVLGVIPAAGERVESATRLAEYHRALAKGASSQEAALAARDVTIDFARGGAFTKTANAYVPFFNVGFQAPAQVWRMMGNPTTRGKALAGVMSTVVMPTMGLEIYNRQDPTYADVPKYDKDRGLVMMSPWGPGPVSPETGRPTPHYFLLSLREWSPFAIAVRDAMSAAVGDGRPAWETASAMIKGGSPIEPSQGLWGVLGDMAPPAIKQIGEQLTNYDTFRDRPIVPDGLKNLPNDQQYTSTTSETAKLAGKLTGQSPLRLEHAVTGLGAGVGRQALAAGDMALKVTGQTPEGSRRVQQLQRDISQTGISDEKRATLQHELDVETAKEQTRTSSVKGTPVLGGFASSIYREQGGQMDRQAGLTNDQRLAALQSDKDPTGKELKRLGMTFSDVDNQIGGRTLSRMQSQEYRTKALDYRQAVLSGLMDSRVYQSADDAEKARLARNAMARAAAWASQEVLPGANKTGQEFTTVAGKDIGRATQGYLSAIQAQAEIDDLADTRYMGFSGSDAEEIATDRGLLSQLRNVTGSESSGDSAFLSRYGARRFSRAKNARVNPAYTASVQRIERASPDLMVYLRSNPLVRDAQPVAV